MNLFIDTNIFLNFYNLSEDDLESLKQIAIMIESKKINLYIPDQVKIEFFKNRDKVISEALKRIKDSSISPNASQIVKSHKNYNQLIDSLKQYEKVRVEIYKDVFDEAKHSKLAADILVNRIFHSSKLLESTEDIIEQAKRRHDLGLPPGKGNKFGDCINWLSLKMNLSSGEKLYFISDDGDYSSLLDGSEFNSFLLQEWWNEKKAELIYYKKLSAFLRANFPDIKMANELEKDLDIQALSTAQSFASAKSKLKKIAQYDVFTAQQLVDIIEAAVSNSQIFWIKDDVGVGDILKNIVSTNMELISPEVLERFREVYGGVSGIRGNNGF